MVLYIYSHNIVGHEVHAANSAEQAAPLMRKASLAKGFGGTQNGAAFRQRQLHETGDGAGNAGKAGHHAVIQ